MGGGGGVGWGDGGGEAVFIPRTLKENDTLHTFMYRVQHAFTTCGQIPHVHSPVVIIGLITRVNTTHASTYYKSRLRSTGMQQTHTRNGEGRNLTVAHARQLDPYFFNLSRSHSFSCEG